MATAPLTISIGIATSPDDAGARDELLDKADWAMYAAKRAGRNRVPAFADDLVRGQTWTSRRGGRPDGAHQACRSGRSVSLTARAEMTNYESRPAVATERSQMISDGMDAPAVVVTTTHGDHVDLSAPPEPLVLFFYREAGSSEAAAAATDFNDLHYEFEAVGVRLLGVGVDGLAATAAFAGSCDLRYQLADDADRAISLAFGVVDTIHGRPHAATFLIATDGVVCRVYGGPPPVGHARDVLDDARALWG